MSYTPPKIPLGLKSPNPKLKDVLDAVKTDILQNMNCVAIATITAVTVHVGSGTQEIVTVNATVNYNKTYFVRQPNGTYQAQTADYPQIVDAPLIGLTGGFTSLTMPVQPGDQCLILFNDRDLNNWFAGATSGPVATARLHSFSDAIALVGFQQSETYSSSHALLTNGIAEVGVAQTNAFPAVQKVRVANDTTTLYNVLSQLITAIEAITVTTSVPSTPGSFTSGTPNNNSALEAARTAIEGLLE